MENMFGVGDPDQSIYRFRGASSAAFHLFRRHFPQTKIVVLGKNRRSTTPIFQCAFALVDKNPPVFRCRCRTGPLAYRRAPLQSAREEDAIQEGKHLPAFPVEAISFTGKTPEAPDVVTDYRRNQARLALQVEGFRHSLSFAFHRDEVAQELAERNIPFSIENMDVSDTPEVRDLFACVAVVVDWVRTPACFGLPRCRGLKSIPKSFVTALRSIAKDSKEGIVSRWYSCLTRLQVGERSSNACDGRGKKSTQECQDPCSARFDRKKI